MNQSYDLAVIGAGPGGYVAAIRASQLGLKTICIDKRPTLGGTCLNVGCIPSKALLHASHQFAGVQEAIREKWMESKGVSVNFARMMRRKEEAVKGLVDGVAGLFRKYKVEWAVGEARLISANQMEIVGADKRVIEAKNILLATGSESIPLPFLPFDEVRVVSSTGALALQKVPEKLLIVGAGVIGVELASVYRRLGSEVTMIEMLEQICPAMDPAISKMLLQILMKQGIDFHLGAKVTAGKVGKDRVKVTVYTADKQEKEFSADVVLVSVGRKPRSQGLGLAEAGVNLDAKGFVNVDGEFRTNIPSIYAIGDLIEGVMLAHRASEEGTVVAELLVGAKPTVNYMAIPNVIYTHPEVAAVGLTEPEAREAGLEVKVGTFPMRANSRSRCTGEVEGLVKVVGDGNTGRLVGMHMITSNASEMIGEGVIAIDRKATVEQVAHASHAHPTQCEAIKEACLALLGHTIHL